MASKGHCYCGNVEYEVQFGPKDVHAQCFCYECRYFSSGGPTCLIVVPAANFKYVKGNPKQYAKQGGIVTREFCGDCGSQLAAVPKRGPVKVVKIGTLNDKSAYKPSVAYFAGEKMPSICIHEGLKQFEGFTPKAKM